MGVSRGKPIAGFMYANTELQSLSEHLFAVGYVAEQLHQCLIPQRKKHSSAAFVAGCMHDLGKLDPLFQSWVTNPKKQNFVAEDGQHIDGVKFSYDKHPRHNEISAMLYQLLDNKSLNTVINNEIKSSIKHVIFWHHAKPFRKGKDLETYGDIYSKLSDNSAADQIEDLFQKACQQLKQVCTIDANYRQLDSSQLTACFAEVIDSYDVSSLRDIKLPKYKDYEATENIDKYKDSVELNADNNIMRACVITADRLISALTTQELHAHIKNKTLNDIVVKVLRKESMLVSHIEQYLISFDASDRSIKQSGVALQLTKVPGIAVLAGAAGCGKTKIALEWAKLKNAQRIIWVCPRVQVCQGLFLELISSQYLPNANIEINTGEYKFTNEWGATTAEDECFNGDIVITTIDQVFNAIISHSKVDMMIDFLNMHVVFDEFHEYVNMPAFNLLFSELVACKKLCGQLVNTLLVSATPHYFFVEKFLDIDGEDIIVMPSFNQSLYQVEFQNFDEKKQDESNPLYKTQDKSTFVISNTAITAQKSFICSQHHENAVLLHSKFKKQDKQKWFGEVYESFKKGGTKRFDVLRSGPIVQASLNITCDYMVTELTNAENFLQRLGRLDRFGENSTVNTYCIAVPESISQGKCTGASAWFLARMNTLATTRAWLKFLQGRLGHQPVNLGMLYDLYHDFYQSDASVLIKSDFVGSLKKSVSSIDDKIFAPLVIAPKKITEKGRAKISKKSLRGDNRFVQMAVLNMNDPNRPEFVDQYAYQMPISERDEIDNLTTSRDEIEGYGDSNRDLLAHMMKKHHNIMGGVKTAKNIILLNDARDPEFPIYLSYTPSDLIFVGGESARHSEAIYYAVCDKQPIGAISIKQLTNSEQ